MGQTLEELIAQRNAQMQSMMGQPMPPTSTLGALAGTSFGAMPQAPPPPTPMPYTPQPMPMAEQLQMVRGQSSPAMQFANHGELKNFINTYGYKPSNFSVAAPKPKKPSKARVLAKRAPGPM